MTSPPTSSPGSLKQLSLNDGTYLVFLDVWEQDINALDDSHIRETALGGPDTTTRVKNVWQVRLLRVSVAIEAGVTCHTPFVAWDTYTAPSTGM